MRKLAQQEKQQPRKASTQNIKVAADPQKKFNHFVKSLLDAMFGPAEAPAQQHQPQRPTTCASRPEKPAFNFHYNLAVEKNTTPYVRGKDGVFRKAPGK